MWFKRKSLPPRPARPSADDQVDVTGLAEERRRTGVPLDDERITADDGKLITFTDPSIVEVDAQNLGAAAEHIVVARAVEEATPPQAEAAALSGEIEQQEDIVDLARTSLALATEEQDTLRSTGDVDRIAGAKVFAWLLKVAMILGDMFLIGTALAGPGTNPILAAISGLAVSSGAVATGSMLGRSHQVAKQRRDRGLAPEGTPDALQFLHQRPGDVDRHDGFWLTMACGFALVIGTAIASFTTGTGGLPMEALGIGLIASVTVFGSAAAEAFATNPAADRASSLDKIIAKGTKTISDHAGLVGVRDGHATTAQMILLRGRHEGAGARLSHLVMASPMADQPRIFGVTARPGVELPKSEPVDMPTLRLPVDFTSTDKHEAAHSAGRDATRQVIARRLARLGAPPDQPEAGEGPTQDNGETQPIQDPDPATDPISEPETPTTIIDLDHTPVSDPPAEPVSSNGDGR